MTDQKTTKCAHIRCRCAVPQDEESCGKACRDAGSCCDLYKAETDCIEVRAHSATAARSSTHRLEGLAHDERNYDQRCRDVSPFAPTYQQKLIGTNTKVEVKSRTCPSSHLVGNGC
jgi:hypothetical protein